MTTWKYKYVNHKMTTCKCDNSNLNFDVYLVKLSTHEITRKCTLLIHCVNVPKKQVFCFEIGAGFETEQNTDIIKSNVLCFSTTEQ